jgi:hypothetical protein
MARVVRHCGLLSGVHFENDALKEPLGLGRLLHHVTERGAETRERRARSAPSTSAQPSTGVNAVSPERQRERMRFLTHAG